jgi:transmembrane sensor
MDKEVIKDLFKRYLNGTCTKAEKALLEDWFLQYNEEELIVLPAGRLAKIGGEIFRNLPPRRTGLARNAYPLMAAAVAVLVISVILSIVFSKQDYIVSRKPRDIIPGENRAILTLVNGEKIDLASAGQGNLVQQPGARIVKNSLNQVIYQPDYDKTHGLQTGENMISTPVGGTWELVLPDGTHVWLNNTSSLIFPSSFQNHKFRNVSLTGEAYFEVAKDKAHPFIVKSGQQEIRVLGTHFDVKAFPEEQFISTTLIEGLVQVRTAGVKDGRQLVPGQQALVSGAAISVIKADSEQVLAWKNGYFSFDNTPIAQVMRELARWYTIDASFKGEPSPEGLSGRISHAKDISQVLKALEATGAVHFKTEGRRVTVMN